MGFGPASSDSNTEQRTISNDRRVTQAESAINLLQSAYVGGQTVNPTSKQTPILVAVIALVLIIGAVVVLKPWFKGRT